MPPDPPAIAVNGLTCHYGVAPVLRDVDLTIPAGEVVAVMGPNGAGKSTLLAAVAGVLSAWRGSVDIHGHRRRGTPESELAARQACVYLPASPFVPTALAAREWVVACGRVWGVDDRRLLDHAGCLLELFDLDPALRPADASTGQRQKLALAGALATDAAVLILDEPFGGGLDHSGIVALRAVLLDAARRRGRTILLAQPVPQLVEGLADRVAILGAGAGPGRAGFAGRPDARDGGRDAGGGVPIARGVGGASRGWRAPGGVRRVFERRVGRRGE